MSVSRRWIIGRVPGCDIVINIPEVSSRHCELTQTPTGYRLADLGSSNGTFVTGARLGPQPVPVARSDTITLGAKTLFPWPEEASALRPRAVPPPLGRSGSDRVITVGRLPSNDLVLNYPMVSGK